MDNQPDYCKNCNEKLSGKYCGNCGQAVFKRFSLSYLGRLLYQDLFEIDRGFWKTFKDITIRPGYMIQDFLGGKTKLYFSPLKYLLVAITLFYLFVASETLISDGSNTKISNEWTEEYSYNDHAPFSIETLNDFFAGGLPIIINKHLTLYFLLLIPFLSLSTMIIFRKYNFIEYIITHTFLWGHIVLMATILGVFVTLLSTLVGILFPTTDFYSFNFILLVLLIGLYLYWFLAFKQLCQYSWWKTILKFILALYGSFIPFFALFVLGFIAIKTILG